MNGRAAARLLRRSVLKGAAGQGAAGAMGRGVEAAGQVSAAATEFLRVRRDPAEIALRRRKSAIRRVKVWSAGAAVAVAAGTALTVGVVADGLVTSMVFSMILVTALLIWCLAGLVRAVSDLRRRSRELAGLPPPQPARRAVASQIRGEIGRLDAYSDGLRRLMSVLPSAPHPLAGLGSDVLASADEAEVVLRRQANEYTALRKAAAGAPRPAQPTLLATAEAHAVLIRDGVREYGRLVTAATETVAASAELAGAVTDLLEPTERLTALAGGMREISRHARIPGSAS